jgi:hypothetical protein
VALYRRIKKEVLATAGFMAESQSIALVLADRGLTTRLAHNRADATARSSPCPEPKRLAIELAIDRILGRHAL